MKDVSNKEIIDEEEKINIINNLVSNLLENTEDLDPRISKIIDEHFWELV